MKLLAKAEPNPYAELQQRVLQVSPQDYLTQEDIFAGGVGIIGATGSGKTTCAANLASGLLRQGFGGVVLTTKPGDRQEWERYAEQAGRSRDLVIFSPQSEAQFNFLEYEMTRKGAGARDSANITDLFYAVIEATGRQSGGGNDSGYWENAVRQLILNACDLCYFARGTVGLADIRNIIGSIAQSRAEVRSEEWRKESFCYRLIEEAEPKPRAVNAQYDFNECVAYFLDELPGLSDKTRSIIVSMFSGMASYFLRGKLRRMFCDKLTLRPDDTWESGKIILIDLPIKEYNNRGRAAQVLFKYAYQRAIERRDVREHPRGCFIWADEAQNVVTSHDAQFCSTSRSSRCSTVYISQSLPVYYNAFSASPERARHDALALLGNMQVKFFHANTEQETCEWMSNLIGKYWVNKTSINLSTNETSDKGQIGRVQSNSGIGTSQMLDHAIQPADWQRMRTGGFRNKGLVDVVLHQGGRQWSTQENFLRITFRQEGF